MASKASRLVIKHPHISKDLIHATTLLERIQDHPATKIDELLPWAYQAMIDAKKKEAA